MSQWTQTWRDNKNPAVPGVPRQWAQWEHPSGYSVGEVDAGRYMAADPRGVGLIDETGDWCSWSSEHGAMEYVENVIAAQAAQQH
jgi:hypothetical protein